MTDSGEITYYKGFNVLVTNTRAVMGGRTFAMANITSVSTAIKAPNPTVWALGIAFGAIATIGGIVSLFDGSIVPIALGCTGFGVLAIVTSLLVLKSQKSTYSVTIGTAGGEANALSSENETQVRDIVEAMNRAIIERG